MQLLCRLTLAPCGCRRCYVAVDGLLPVTGARKGMRWHVQRMRRIRRDVRVTSRGHQRPSCQRRHIVRMDNVMCQPGMRWLLFKQFLEDRSRLQPPRVGLVCRIFRSRDRQRIEDLCLMVFRIFRSDLLHGVAISDQPCSLRLALVLDVQLADGGKIRPFPLRLCAQCIAALRALTPCLQLTLVFHARRERITPIAQRDSPICDSTCRVLALRRVESFYGTAELEGMKQRYRAIEFLLCYFVARCGKLHCPQFLTIPMLMLLREATRCQHQ